MQCCCVLCSVYCVLCSVYCVLRAVQCVPSMAALTAVSLLQYCPVKQPCHCDVRPIQTSGQYTQAEHNNYTEDTHTHTDTRVLCSVSIHLQRSMQPHSSPLLMYAYTMMYAYTTMHGRTLVTRVLCLHCNLSRIPSRN